MSEFEPIINQEATVQDVFEDLFGRVVEVTGRAIAATSNDQTFRGNAARSMVDDFSNANFAGSGLRVYEAVDLPLMKFVGSKNGGFDSHIDRARTRRVAVRVPKGEQYALLDHTYYDLRSHSTHGDRQTSARIPGRVEAARGTEKGWMLDFAMGVGSILGEVSVHVGRLGIQRTGVTRDQLRDEPRGLEVISGNMTVDQLDDLAAKRLSVVARNVLARVSTVNRILEGDNVEVALEATGHLTAQEPALE